MCSLLFGRERIRKGVEGKAMEGQTRYGSSEPRAGGRERDKESKRASKRHIKKGCSHLMFQSNRLIDINGPSLSRANPSSTRDTRVVARLSGLDKIFNLFLFFFAGLIAFGSRHRNESE